MLHQSKLAFWQATQITDSYLSILMAASSAGYTLPSVAQQTKQRTLIASLKAAGIWDKLDVLQVFATDGDQNFALIDWKNPIRKATRVGTLTHTANQGYNNDGVSSYIDTNWNPSTQGVNFTLNNASKGAWIHTATSGGTSNDAIMAGQASTGSQRFTNAGSNGQHTHSTAVLDSALSFAGAGLKSLNRISATDIVAYNNLTMDTRIQAANAIASDNLLLFRSTSTYSNGTAKTAVFWAGAPLVAENTALFNAIDVYMTSL